MQYDLIIGIDPGTTTGYAIWNKKEKKFEFIGCGKVLEVMRKLEIYGIFWKTLFLIENPNLRKWYGKNSSQKLQGAGSIKRDYSIWLEWFEYNEVSFKELNPKNIKTKINSVQFEKLTGWKGKTNNHSRDAAMMVFGF